MKCIDSTKLCSESGILDFIIIFLDLSAGNSFFRMNIQKLLMETLRICVGLATLDWTKID